jgi:hypothetical protein
MHISNSNEHRQGFEVSGGYINQTERALLKKAKDA